MVFPHKEPVMRQEFHAMPYHSLIVALQRHMAKYIWVNIGLDNGLLPDDNKPVHEPVLINNQMRSVPFI